jgi:tetratricopeptide (TPR) repeat protein
MKVIILILLALIIDPGKIGKINTLKSEAKEAYKKGDFKTAISKYRNLVDSLGVDEDEVRLNLANAYFQSDDTVNTAISYQPLTQSKTASIRSIAHQQLGVLSNRQNKYEEALASFKQALKADPTNEDARYNYEMVKKKLDEQKKKEEEQKKNDPNKDEKNKDQKDQNKDQKDQKQDQKDKQDKEKQDQESKDQKDQKDQQEKDEKEKKEKESKEKKEKEDQQENKEKKETPPSVSDKLKQMEMSEEKAQMILEAMKNQEIQYLQQNKRKATKPKDKGKPDW